MIYNTAISSDNLPSPNRSTLTLRAAVGIEDKRPLTKFQRDIVKRAAGHLARTTGTKVDLKKIRLAEHANEVLGEQGDQLIRRQ